MENEFRTREPHEIKVTPIVSGDSEDEFLGDVSTKKFDSSILLGKERSLFERLKGKAKKLSEIFLLASAFAVSTSAHAEEKKLDLSPQIEKSVSQSEGIRFLSLESNDQVPYLEKLSHEPAVFTDTTEMWGEQEVKGKKLVQESGLKRIVDMKEELEKTYEKESDPVRKERIYEAYLKTHKFVLEHGVGSFGEVEVSVKNNSGRVNIGELLNRRLFERSLDNVDKFLEEGKEGDLVRKLVEEVKNVKGSELSKIKQIYDIVAYKVPQYKWYNGPTDRGAHGYQSFENVLKHQAGICTEKNALLVYALQQAGIKAVPWGFGGHIFTRVFTSEGVVEIDVTNSDPFALNKLSTKGEYVYGTDEGGVANLPSNLKKYADKEGDDKFEVAIPLDTSEAIEFVAKKNSVPKEQVEEILKDIASVKPHPLYKIVDSGAITPEKAGKYRADLFKE